MTWVIVDTQHDLDLLTRSVSWHDTETLEFYGKQTNESYFPPDVSRSGRVKMNVHVLCRVYSAPSPYLELVFIDCDLFSARDLCALRIAGRVRSLKRVELQDDRSSTTIRCSRLVYRFLDDVDFEHGSYSRHSESVS